MAGFSYVVPFNVTWSQAVILGHAVRVREADGWSQDLQPLAVLK
jgi:hypothetical protein